MRLIILSTFIVFGFTTLFGCNSRLEKGVKDIESLHTESEKRNDDVDKLAEPNPISRGSEN